MTERKGKPEQIPKKWDYFIVKWKEGRVLKVSTSWILTVKIQGKTSEILNGDLWKQIDKRKKYYRKKRKTLKKNTKKKDQKIEKDLEDIWVSPVIKKHIKVTTEVLQKLRLYFSLWFSDEKACYYANISTSTLYNYQKKYPCFLEEKNMMKETLTDEAKIVVAKSIKSWDLQSCWKYLEKKLPQEFGNKQKIELGLNEYIFTSNLND